MLTSSQVAQIAEARCRADGGPCATVHLDGTLVFSGSRYGAVGMARDLHYNWPHRHVVFAEYDGSETTDIKSLRY